MMLKDTISPTLDHFMPFDIGPAQLALILIRGNGLSCLIIDKHALPNRFNDLKVMLLQILLRT